MNVQFAKNTMSGKDVAVEEVTVKQAAAATSRSERWVQRLVKAGRIKGRKVREFGRDKWYLNLEHLEDVVREECIDSQPLKRDPRQSLAEAVEAVQSSFAQQFADMQQTERARTEAIQMELERFKKRNDLLLDKLKEQQIQIADLSEKLAVSESIRMELSRQILVGSQSNSKPKIWQQWFRTR